MVKGAGGWWSETLEITKMRAGDRQYSAAPSSPLRISILGLLHIPARVISRRLGRRRFGDGGSSGVKVVFSGSRALIVSSVVLTSCFRTATKDPKPAFQSTIITIQVLLLECGTKKHCFH